MNSSSRLISLRPFSLLFSSSFTATFALPHGMHSSNPVFFLRLTWLKGLLHCHRRDLCIAPATSMHRSKLHGDDRRPADYLGPVSFHPGRLTIDCSGHLWMFVPGAACTKQSTTLQVATNFETKTCPRAPPLRLVDLVHQKTVAKKLPCIFAASSQPNAAS